MKTIVLIFALFSFSAVLGQRTYVNANNFSLQTNPLYPFTGAYSLKGYFNASKWSIGVVTEGNLTLPEFVRDQFFENAKDKEVTWEYAVGIEGLYRFNKRKFDLSGFYLAGGAGYESWNVGFDEDAFTMGDRNANVDFTNWYASAGVGYNWFPFKRSGFYAGANYFLIFILNNTQEQQLEGSAFNIRPVVPPTAFPNIYVGWQFGKRTE